MLIELLKRTEICKLILLIGMCYSVNGYTLNTSPQLEIRQIIEDSKDWWVPRVGGFQGLVVVWNTIVVERWWSNHAGVLGSILGDGWLFTSL